MEGKIRSASLFLKQETGASLLFKSVSKEQKPASVLRNRKAHSCTLITSLHGKRNNRCGNKNLPPPQGEKKRNHIEEVILKAPSSFEHIPCPHSLRTKPHCSHRPAPLGTGPGFPTSAVSFLRHVKQHLLQLFLRLGAFFPANVRAVGTGSALMVVEKPAHKTGKTNW